MRRRERHIGYAAPSTVRREKDLIKKLRACYPAARLVPNIDVRGGDCSCLVEGPVLGFKNCGVARSAVRWDNRKRDRLIVGPANRWFTSKNLKRLDRRCRDFIAASPYLILRILAER